MTSGFPLAVVLFFYCFSEKRMANDEQKNAGQSSVVSDRYDKDGAAKAIERWALK